MKHRSVFVWSENVGESEGNDRFAYQKLFILAPEKGKEKENWSLNMAFGVYEVIFYIS